MNIELLRAELERLFELEELLQLSRDLLGFEPEAVGGTAGVTSFARALALHCAEHDAVEALCDAVLVSKHDVNPDVAMLGARGLLPGDEIALGERLGPFLIVRKLGEGPHGISYVARNEDAEVRLKVLRFEASRETRALRRFLTLTRLAARVIHPGLPWRIRTGLADGRHYVVHEAIEGQTLATRISRTGPMHINEAQALLLAILDAASALHRERVIHGNLKLENVVLHHTEDGVAKIVVLDACGDRLHARPPANGHQEPWSVGSPKTVAPETLRGYPLSPASDIYAFGAMMFEILTGKPVFSFASVSDAIVAHLAEPPRAPSSVAPRGWVGREVDAFVLALLDKNPAARPVSFEAVRATLAELGRPGAIATAVTMSDEDLAALVAPVLEAPTNEEAALALESAAAAGADPARVAEAFLEAAASIDPSGEEAERSAAQGLLFRAARLFQEVARDLARAETAYAAILNYDPNEATAIARLDDVRKKLGKHEEIVESLIGRAERAADGEPRAEIFARIGRIYKNDLADEEQALIAMTQAFTEDPKNAESARLIEQLAGNDTARWEEVLTACAEASAVEKPADYKNALFARMAVWYEERSLRPDLALQCLQAILATDPGNEEALRTLASIYKKAQQWAELAALSIRRAEMAVDPQKAVELRVEAANLYEHQLNDVGAARELYSEIMKIDPANVPANDALGRLYEQGRDYPNLLRLLDKQVERAPSEERPRLLCKVAQIYEDELSDDTEAAKRYQAVLSEDHDNPDALRGLDRLHSKAGRFKDLLENLEHQLRIAVTPRQRITLYERIAGIYDEEFLDHGKAAEAFEQILAIDPSHALSLGELGRHYRALGRWEDLVGLLEKKESIATDAKEKLELWLAKARVLADQLDVLDLAILAYERVLELDPENSGALEALARLRERAGQEDAALEAIDALAERTESPEARAEHLLRAAKLLEARGDVGAAIDRYKRALDARPKDEAIAEAIRSLYVARGDVNAAAELLERQIADTEGERQKAKLFAELATLCRTKLKDDARAEKAASRAVDHDPTNIEAVTALADIAFEGDRFVEAAASYEKLAGRADSLPREEAVRVLERFVDALSKSGSTERALVAMDTLLRLSPDDPKALARVAAVTFEHGSPGRARELYADLLGVFDASLTSETRFIATYRFGESARRTGALDAAIASLETATELDPSSPLPLTALATAYEAKEDWAKVVDAKTRHLDIASGEDRVRLLVEIGDLGATKLNDRALATKSLVAALDERPDDRKLLTRLMQLYSEEKDWQKLVDIVLKLANFVEDPKQKSKYLSTAAMVTGHELADYDRAVLYYDKVLELDPSNEKAVDDIIDLLEQKGDFSGAVDRLKAKAQAASETKNTPRMLEAFGRLFPIYKDKLERIGHAVDALEAAQTLEPDNAERNNTLAELYALYPERFMDKAIRAQLLMLKENPYRVESYKLLRRLYTESQQADPAFCLCQALYVLKLAEPDEERFFRRMRPEDPAYAKAVVTPDDWLESILHADADAMLTSLFALIEPAIILSRSESRQAAYYHPDFAIDAANHPHPFYQTLHYAAGVLGMELPPIFEDANESALGFAHTATPSILIGRDAMENPGTPQAMAFAAARHLAYYRPGFYIRHLLSATGLRSWLFAAIKLNAPQFPVAPDIEGSVINAMTALEKHLTIDLRDHLARVVSKLIQSGAALDLRRWVQGIDFTADRSGFILAHDLETAIEIVRASDENSSSVAPQARLKDLVLYAISEQYFRIRERLGIGIAS